MHRYFAYGSNLSTAQMAQRCSSLRVVGRALLRDYRLGFPRLCDEWDGGVAGLVRDATEHVEGVVWALKDDGLAMLDTYEGVTEGQYERRHVQVELPSRSTVEVWTYFAVAQEGGPFLPPRRYIQTMLCGAREHSLSEAWIRRLEDLLSMTNQ